MHVRNKAFVHNCELEAQQEPDFLYEPTKPSRAGITQCLDFRWSSFSNNAIVYEGKCGKVIVVPHTSLRTSVLNNWTPGYACRNFGMEHQLKVDEEWSPTGKCMKALCSEITGYILEKTVANSKHKLLMNCGNACTTTDNPNAGNVQCYGDNVPS